MGIAMEIWENLNMTLCTLLATLLAAERLFKIELPHWLQAFGGAMVMAIITSVPLMIIVTIWS